MTLFKEPNWLQYRAMYDVLSIPFPWRFERINNRQYLYKMLPLECYSNGLYIVRSHAEADSSENYATTHTERYQLTKLSLIGPIY